MVLIWAWRWWQSSLPPFITHTPACPSPFDLLALMMTLVSCSAVVSNHDLGVVAVTALTNAMVGL